MTWTTGPAPRDTLQTRRNALVMRLPDAIRSYVAPGMHLHFASTPSRSNAAIREIARMFIDTRPGFQLSATGFHSMAHLLPMLGLAERLVACFFGDHYPAPRPNRLYTQLAAAGVAFQHWPLWSMVASFRAGAEGTDWVVNRSLRGTTMAAELAAQSAYREVALPVRSPEARWPPPVATTVGLCAALRPDVTFVHAAAADAEGHVIMSGPLSEGLWSALAARDGVIVTVERIASVAETRAHPTMIELPPHRVLAICEEPFGAHPQPFYGVAELGIAGYRDDFDHYERWRALTVDPARFAGFADAVLRAPDGALAYRDYVGRGRLAALRAPEPPRFVAESSPDSRGVPGFASIATSGAASITIPGVAPGAASGAGSDAAGPERAAIDQLIVAGARQLVARVRAIGARVLIGGIGHAFFAARLAQLQLARDGIALRVMVETGLYDVDCGPESHGYLLAYDNVTRARRLTAVDDILGVLTCGADNHCIAALGAAQIDRYGNLNSTRLGGQLLVGSGGACDIAASAEEVVVMTRLLPGRLVADLEYITSPGHGVRSVVTDRCVLMRSSPRHGMWTIASVTEPRPATTVALAVAALQRECQWPLAPAPELAYAQPITPSEAKLLDVLDPTGTYRHRTG
jgi:acyl CoA:acetate/3-ketoacid CoA transferase alpha subunit